MGLIDSASLLTISCRTPAEVRFLLVNRRDGTAWRLWTSSH